jgi:hypothetical protein
VNWENAFWFRNFGAGVFVGFLLRKVFGGVKGFWRLGVFGVFVIYNFKYFIMELVNVLEGVCFVMGQDINRVKTKGRFRELVVCRHLFYYLSKYYYGATLKQIGQLTNTDHTSVIHGINVINDLLSIKDENIQNALSSIQDYISQRYMIDKKISVFVPYDVNLSELAEMLQNTYRCRVIL